MMVMENKLKGSAVETRVHIKAFYGKELGSIVMFSIFFLQKIRL